MKQCPRCQKTKSESDFGKDSNRKDGLYYYCRECKKRHDDANRTLVATKKNKTSAEWRKANPEYHKSWWKSNKELSNKYTREKKNRKLNCEGSHTEAQWKSLCKKYGNKCLCCGKKTTLTRDHIIPLTKGGTDYISNIQPLCGSCNSKKRTKTIDYRPR
jgi:5-methylcytosine-specific restriction endonuclease McrA